MAIQQPTVTGPAPGRRRSVGRPVDPVRRQALIAAAARLFRQRGYEGTTVRDVARECGVHSGSLFYHFRNKEDLLLAVMLEGMKQFAYAACQPLDPAQSPRDRLRALFLGHLTALHGGGDEQAVVISEWRSLPAAARRRVVRRRDRIEAVWRDSLAEARAAGLVEGDLRLLRLAMLGALNWTLQWYDKRGPLSLERLAENLLAVFLHGPCVIACSPAGVSHPVGVDGERQ
jgi:AcrR family transcriptional regulator